MITLLLTEQEANALGQLLDIATKAGGLQVAQAAVVLASKLAQASQAAKEPTDVAAASS